MLYIYRYTISALCIWVIGFLTCVIYAQESPHYIISDTVLVEGKRILLYPSQLTRIQKIDIDPLKTIFSRNLGDIISKYTLISNRDNGPGGLMLLTSRGLSASHIQVVWNGISLKHNGLGLTDMSIIPSSFIDDVEVGTSISGGMYGNGGFGGGVVMTSNVSKPHLNIHQSFRSYGNYDTQIDIGFRISEITLRSRIYNVFGKNRFVYYNPYTKANEKREHNEDYQIHFLQDIVWKKNNIQIEAHYMTNHNFHNLPGSILETFPQARQVDHSHKAILIGKWWDKSIFITTRHFFNEHQIQYKDPNFDIESFSKHTKWVSQIDISAFLFSNLSLYGLTQVKISRGVADNYQFIEKRFEWNTNVSGNLSFLQKRIHIYPILNISKLQHEDFILLPSIGLTTHILDSFLWRGKWTKEYRSPTFNDLYWTPGGNPNLKSEKGFKVESGFSYQKMPIDLSITLYYISLNNGILWLPNVDNIWSPINRDKIISKGVELDGITKLSIPNLGFELHYTQSFTWQRAYYREKRFDGDAAVSAQLRYVPKIMLKGNIMFFNSFLRMDGQWQWTSRRFLTDTEDITHSLSSYFNLDMVVAYTYASPFNTQSTLTVGIKNIMNTSYEIVANYPQALRNYFLALSITF